MNADAITYTESMSHNQSVSPMVQAITRSGVTKVEDQLIARLRRGDEGAFDELVNQHHSALIRMAQFSASPRT